MKFWLRSVLITAIILVLLQTAGFVLKQGSDLRARTQLTQRGWVFKDQGFIPLIGGGKGIPLFGKAVQAELNLDRDGTPIPLVIEEVNRIGELASVQYLSVAGNTPLSIEAARALGQVGSLRGLSLRGFDLSRESLRAILAGKNQIEYLQIRGGRTPCTALHEVFDRTLVLDIDDYAFSIAEVKMCLPVDCKCLVYIRTNFGRFKL